MSSSDPSRQRSSTLTSTLSRALASTLRSAPSNPALAPTISAPSSPARPTWAPSGTRGPKRRGSIPNWMGGAPTAEEDEVPRVGRKAEGTLGLGWDPAELGLGRELEEEQDEMSEVVGKVIYQAGVDFETRPMVILSASALPDPREVNYDDLLSRILFTLSVFAESDYTLVFFAAGGRYSPSWAWILRAYRGLSRKYRKNLKKLYIVHSSFFSKMLLSTLSTLISPKFYRKIHYIPSLSALGAHVPLSQIEIPPAVFAQNAKVEPAPSLSPDVHAPDSQMFGAPLESLMGKHGERGSVPRVVRDAVEKIRRDGLATEGLFRRSPNSQVLKQVQEAYNRGHPISLSSYPDPHLPAVLLKSFFRSLPTPVFSAQHTSLLARTPLPTSSHAAITYIRETVLASIEPRAAHIVLGYVLQLLHEVSLRAGKNKMDAFNLAVVWGPNLYRTGSVGRDIAFCAVPQEGRPEGKEATFGGVLKCMIEHYYEIFDAYHDPGTISTARSAVFTSLPSSPSLPVSTGSSISPSTSHTNTHKRTNTESSLGQQSTTTLSSSVNAGGGTGTSPVRTTRRSAYSIDKTTFAGGSIALRPGAPGAAQAGAVSASSPKAVGAGVEAVGVSASGSFSNPAFEESESPVGSAGVPRRDLSLVDEGTEAEAQ